jgi:serine/threonine protein kinase
MAPEVKRGQYSLPADIYSLGLVLYEIFERKLPLYDQARQTVVLPKSFQVCLLLFFLISASLLL